VKDHSRICVPGGLWDGLHGYLSVALPGGPEERSSQRGGCRRTSCVSLRA
jgi:hypothetical protein